MVFSLLSLSLYASYTYAAVLRGAHATPLSLRQVDVDANTPRLGVSRDVQQSWSQYSPYFPASPYVGPPAGCKVDQANIIQRHGARFPTSGATNRIKAALAKLAAVDEFTDPRLAFIKDYAYTLGKDALVPLGAEQSRDSGREAFDRYAAIVSAQKLPFVRASDSERVIFSAANWTAGFALASHNQLRPSVDLIISEEGNDTLDDNMCPAAGSSDPQTDQWLATFAPPITAVLNDGAPGANLTDTDTYNLFALCAFETVAFEKRSKFCDLYEELNVGPGFAYTGDLDKYYNTGPGQPLGPVQGVGYINELLARLTGKPVVDHTQTNSTLDSDPATFPLDRTVYADFSHDNAMIPVYAALGLFRQPAPLDPTRPAPVRDFGSGTAGEPGGPEGTRTWVTERLVPFSARMVVERLACAGHGRKGAFVRILVNDALQPLEFCGKGDGVCSLDAFVESQAYARNDGNGDFEKCFE